MALAVASYFTVLTVAILKNKSFYSFFSSNFKWCSYKVLFSSMYAFVVNNFCRSHFDVCKIVTCTIIVILSRIFFYHIIKNNMGDYYLEYLFH